MQNRYKVLSVWDKNKMDVQSAYVVYDPNLRDQSRQLELQHVTKYAHECTRDIRYDVKPDGTLCNDNLEPIDPRFIEQYITLEYKQAKLAADYLARKVIMASRIPVLYGPDSAIHIAEGILDGLKGRGVEYSLFPVDRDESIPSKAIDLALKTHQILYCDSVMNYGIVSSNILAKLPDVGSAPPLKVLTYFSHATALDMPGDGILRNDRKPLKGLEILQNAIKALGHDLECYVTDIGDVSADLFDRADAIAYAANYSPDLLRYVHKFLKVDAHNASHFRKE